MTFKIMANGKEINRIVANEIFCSDYCQKYGYTFEAIPTEHKNIQPTTDYTAEQHTQFIWDAMAESYRKGVNEA